MKSSIHMWKKSGNGGKFTIILALFNIFDIVKRAENWAGGGGFLKPYFHFIKEGWQFYIYYEISDFSDTFLIVSNLKYQKNL